MQVLGWIVIAVVGAFLVVNASVMLVSPRAWFRLPGWLRAQGALTEERYGSGFGAIQLRIGAALILGTIAWITFDSLRH